MFSVTFPRLMTEAAVNHSRMCKWRNISSFWHSIGRRSQRRDGRLSGSQLQARTHSEPGCLDISVAVSQALVEATTEATAAKREPCNPSRRTVTNTFGVTFHPLGSGSARFCPCLFAALCFLAASSSDAEEQCSRAHPLREHAHAHVQVGSCSIACYLATSYVFLRISIRFCKEACLSGVDGSKFCRSTR